MEANESQVQEIRATLQECEFPSDIIAQVLSETTDPEKAFDLAVVLNELRLKQASTPPEKPAELIIGDLKMVFIVRTDAPFDRKRLFQAIGTSGGLISSAVLSTGPRNPHRGS
jgi:hypothetical protein